VARQRPQAFNKASNSEPTTQTLTQSATQFHQGANRTNQTTHNTHTLTLKQPHTATHTYTHTHTTTHTSHNHTHRPLNTPPPENRDLTRNTHSLTHISATVAVEALCPIDAPSPRGVEVPHTVVRVGEGDHLGTHTNLHDPSTIPTRQQTHAG
jgi:hypothetical protein